MAGIGIEAPPCMSRREKAPYPKHQKKLTSQSQYLQHRSSSLSYNTLLPPNFKPVQKHGCKLLPAGPAKPACPSCLSLPHAPVTYANKADDMLCPLARIQTRRCSGITGLCSSRRQLWSSSPWRRPPATAISRSTATAATARWPETRRIRKSALTQEHDVKSWLSLLQTASISWWSAFLGSKCLTISCVCLRYTMPFLACVLPSPYLACV